MTNQGTKDFVARDFLERELDRHLGQIGVLLPPPLRKVVVEKIDLAGAQHYIDHDLKVTRGAGRKRAIKHKRRIKYLLRRFVHSAQTQLGGRGTMTGEDLRIVYENMLPTKTEPGYVIASYHNLPFMRTYPCPPLPQPPNPRTASKRRRNTNP